MPGHLALTRGIKRMPASPPRPQTAVVAYQVNGCRRLGDRRVASDESSGKGARQAGQWGGGGQHAAYPARVSRRHLRAAEATPDPLNPSGILSIPDGVLEVLAVLPSASLVVAPNGTVLHASARAQALGLVNRLRIVVPEIASLATDADEGAGLVEREMRVRRPPLGRELLELRARAAMLDTGAVLILIDDLSEERRVDAVRRDFVANVSHELKTPVGAMSILAEAIGAATDDPEQVRHFAERMQVEASRLASLIQDVIDLSRLQGDDPAVRAEVVDVDDVLVRAVDEVRTLAASHHVEFILGEPAGAYILGDRSQLQTAVRNLLTNAISYSPSHTRVAVDARSADGIVEIIVKDQGIGIPANDLDRIFERFYRVDPARSRVTGGTGLGLAIVKHVCQNHGGECRAWSEVGVGSTFTLRLPAYADLQDAPGLEVVP